MDVLRCVKFNDANTGTVVGDLGVIVRTTNGGSNWEFKPSGTANNLTGVFFTDANTGTVVGSGGAILRTTSGGQITGFSQTSSVNPEKFNLSQNYPNPFNPSTKIKFDLPQAGNVNLRVFDVLGREVSVLVNESLKPGKYEVDFDASALPSGVYFYNLIAGGHVETRKMILLK